VSECAPGSSIEDVSMSPRTTPSKNGEENSPEISPEDAMSLESTRRARMMAATTPALSQPSSPALMQLNSPFKMTSTTTSTPRPRAATITWTRCSSTRRTVSNSSLLVRLATTLTFQAAALAIPMSPVCQGALRKSRIGLCSGVGTVCSTRVA
jgi:hypothetical protein